MDIGKSPKNTAGKKTGKVGSKSTVVSSVARTLDEIRTEIPIYLDPGIVDPSIAQDRFEPDSDTRKSMANLIESIRESGQNQPALVRPHPQAKGRYQLAYGHRRLEAIKILAKESKDPEKWKFKAFVKHLGDEELLLLQTSENSERENLTWIETAMWAQKLTESCSIPQKKLALRIGTNESGISRMLAVVRIIPHDIIQKIGRAPSVGQPRWSSFSNLLSKQDVVSAIRKKIGTQQFESLNPLEKFNTALKFATDAKNATTPAKKGKDTQRNSTKMTDNTVSFNGQNFCTVDSTKTGTQISIPSREAMFAAWLKGQLPKLYGEYKANHEADGGENSMELTPSTKR